MDERKYQVDGELEDARVCYLVEGYIRSWHASFEDPMVRSGAIDSLDSLYVKAWEEELEQEGYLLEYDIDEEGFWAIRIADGKAIDFFSYYFYC